MGFFDFVKGVGKKIFGASEAQAAPAAELAKEVASHGFDTSKLEIRTEGDKVTISGQAVTTEEAERIILALGNTMGVAQVDTSALSVAAPATQATMYTVKKGDSLWKIAEAHYGKGKGADYKKILEANMPPIKDENMIQPGWVLRIP